MVIARVITIALETSFKHLVVLDLQRTVTIVQLGVPVHQLLVKKQLKVSSMDLTEVHLIQLPILALLMKFQNKQISSTISGVPIVMQRMAHIIKQPARSPTLLKDSLSFKMASVNHFGTDLLVRLKLSLKMFMLFLAFYANIRA